MERLFLKLVLISSVMLNVSCSKTSADNSNTSSGTGKITRSENARNNNVINTEVREEINTENNYSSEELPDSVKKFLAAKENSESPEDNYSQDSDQDDSYDQASEAENYSDDSASVRVRDNSSNHAYNTKEEPEILPDISDIKERDDLDEVVF